MPVEKLNPDYNLEEARLHQLKSLFPEVVKDGDIDFEVLREVLGLGEDDDSVEHFGLSWAGKRQARKISTNPSKGTLIPLQGEGINEDSTGNIFIEGDNLEVLKLLQKSYAGRIKMIYIDPPYNTGNDFIYKDDFKDSTADYLQKTGQANEKGQLLTSNPKSSGRYHANWLSMMYPRLRVAKNLLTEDGVIFISIDDNEVHNLRALCNEIFGEENFIGQIIIQSNKRGQTYKDISKTHEYLICYTNNIENELKELEKQSINLQFLDAISSFDIRELRNRNPKFGKFNRPNLFFPIYVAPKTQNEDGFCSISLTMSEEYYVEVYPLNSEGKESCWRWSKNKINQQKYLQDITKSSLIARQKRDGGYNIYEKYRKTTYKAKSIWDENEVISEQGTIDLKHLGLKGLFDFPKPVKLLIKSITLGSEEDDIILDFFAGSCTTAQAVMELNKEDGGDRKFICVQIGEETDEKSEAFKAGYKNIAEIGKERIRRAIKKIEEELSGQLELKAKPDLGFKVYKLHQSNLKLWQDYEGSNTQQLEIKLLETENPFREGWTPEKVITEIQLLEGFPLDSSITQSLNFTKNQVVCLSHPDIGHRLFICLDEKLDIDTIQQVRLLEDDDRFICLDYALTDQQKVMLEDGCNVKTI